MNWGKSSTKVGALLKKKTGKSFQDLMKDGHSLADVLKIVQDSAKKSHTNFNELWGSAEAGKAAMALLNGGVDEFNETVKTMASNTDDIGEALNKLDTPSEKANKALNRIKNSGIQIGTSFMSALLPAIDKISAGIEKLTDWFSGLNDATKTTIAFSMAAVGATAPILIFLGKFISSIGAIIAFIPTLTAGMGAVKAGFIALKVAMMANPIGLVITLLSGLAVAFITVWNTNENFRKAVIKAWETIRNSVGKAISTLSQTVSTKWNQINTTVTTVVNRISSTVTTVWNGIKTTVSTIMNGIKAAFSTSWNTIKTTVSTAVNSVKTAISTGMNIAKTAVSTSLDSIKTKFSTIWNGAVRVVKGAIEKIKSALNFKWSLPSLKVPQPTITGKFSLNPPSVPTFGLKWHKKAMDMPYMFKSPTIFGMQGGNLLGAGEAGNEIMYGKQNLMNDITSAVSKGNALSNENDLIIESLREIVSTLRTFLPNLEGLQKIQVTLDSRSVAKQISPRIDEEFGRMQSLRVRGL
ncbi:Phage tail length tape-measure protein [Lachnospiraceae bacterium TWA4]|nr:Phage tail length tape-measure protein [Lachnospiraceae bacterium TWA4]